MPLARGSVSDAPRALYGDLSRIPNNRIRFVRSGQWKLIVNVSTGLEELYDLSRDPNETTSRIADEPEVYARLGALLGDYLRAQQEARPPVQRRVVDPATVEALKALGYVVEPEH
jgi:hypothetical protein